MAELADALTLPRYKNVWSFHMRTKKEADDYLRRNPSFLKWMNSCSLCGTIGYRPDMPEFDAENIEPSFAFKNLRTYFQPLEVSEHGICTQCARHTSCWVWTSRINKRKPSGFSLVFHMCAGMAELADALDLGSSGVTRGSSSLFTRTKSKATFSIGIKSTESVAFLLW